MSDHEPADVVEVRVRHVPRFGVFMGLGAVVGLLVAGVLTFTGSYEASTAVGVTYPSGQVFGFVLLWTVPAGIALGGLVALVMERLARRHDRVVRAAHDIGVLPAEDDAAETD